MSLFTVHLASTTCTYAQIKSVDIPHASEQLDETSVSKGRPDDQAGRSQTPCSEIDHGEQECRQGKAAQPKWYWVAKLEGRLLIETRLKGTAKGPIQRLAVVCEGVRQRIAAVLIVTMRPFVANMVGGAVLCDCMVVMVGVAAFPGHDVGVAMVCE